MLVSSFYMRISYQLIGLWATWLSSGNKPLLESFDNVIMHSCLISVSANINLALGRPTWAPSQYPKRRLFVRSRKVSKPRDWYFKLSYRFEIWLAHRQHCCRSACQISEQSDNSKYKSRGFETLRDLTERRLFGYWDGAPAEQYTFSTLSPTYFF